MCLQSSNHTIKQTGQDGPMGDIMSNKILFALFNAIVKNIKPTN